jgi:hypothetical protein
LNQTAFVEQGVAKTSAEQPRTVLEIDNLQTCVATFLALIAARVGRLGQQLSVSVIARSARGEPDELVRFERHRAKPRLAIAAVIEGWRFVFPHRALRRDAG